MGDAQRGDDALAYFGATLGATRALGVSVAPAQTSDPDGPLPPGRYLLHISDLDPVAAKVWVRMGKYVRGEVLGVAASPPAFPMQLGGIVAIEVNVRRGDNDRIAAVMAGILDTAVLYITEISRPGG